MTSTFQSSTPFNADFRISGMELNHLQAIGKLMQAHRPDDFSDDTIHLTSDDVNSIGELVVFLAQSRMNFDEETDKTASETLRKALIEEQIKTIDFMSKQSKSHKKGKKK